MFKCSRTGLLLLNLTQGLDDMDPSSHKFLRRYVPHPFDAPGRSVAMAAVGADEPGAAVLQKLSGLEGVPWTMFNGVTVVSATQETSVPKVHGDPAVVEEIDCRDLNDPHHDRQLRDHIGRHPMVIGGILSSCKQKLLTHLRKARVAVERGNGRAIIIFRCKSARHRSVSAATMFAFLMRMIGVPVCVHHAGSHS